MAIFHIDLNSISAVNLVLVIFKVTARKINFQAVAICVEYCLPLLTAYSSSKAKNNILRAEEAVESVAPSVRWPKLEGKKQVSEFLRLDCPDDPGDRNVDFCAVTILQCEFLKL